MDKKKLGGKSSRRHLGHLKLSIYEDSSALIVTTTTVLHSSSPSNTGLSSSIPCPYTNFMNKQMLVCFDSLYLPPHSLFYIVYTLSPVGWSQQVNGWYQLLDEGRGFAENVPVPHSLVSMGSQSSLSSTVSAPPSVTKCYAVRNINK
uniref:Uncharacterized protein n=1 Tax=Amphimedon queenslandica TaxID=400682 RepID=A0A1X7TY34_AMPQE